MSAAKPPVAIRITRPYQSEEEFLASELTTISRSGITLVGAQERPEGTVLRFEVTLASGATLLRGEGRVVAYKPAVQGGEPGLALRFTRLDSKSKALVDRVSALREVRRRTPPPVKPPPSKVPPAPPSSDTAVSKQAADRDTKAAAPPPLPARAAAPAPPPPADRSSTLDRLRQRSLTPEQIARILADGASRRTR